MFAAAHPVRCAAGSRKVDYARAGASCAHNRNSRTIPLAVQTVNTHSRAGKAATASGIAPSNRFSNNHRSLRSTMHDAARQPSPVALHLAFCHPEMHECFPSHFKDERPSKLGMMPVRSLLYSNTDLRCKTMQMASPHTAARWDTMGHDRTGHDATDRSAVMADNVEGRVPWIRVL